MYRHIFIFTYANIWCYNIWVDLVLDNTKHQKGWMASLNSMSASYIRPNIRLVDGHSPHLYSPYRRTFLCQPNISYVTDSCDTNGTKKYRPSVLRLTIYVYVCIIRKRRRCFGSKIYWLFFSLGCFLKNSRSNRIKFF